jgi:Ca2+-binding RTX toxin-like protein
MGTPATIVAQPGVTTPGTAGPDVIYGIAGPDVIYGTAGDDKIAANVARTG